MNDRSAHAAGFMVGKKAEAGGIAKDGAKMVMAVANVKVSTQTALWAGRLAEGWLKGWLRVPLSGCGAWLRGG